MIKKIAVVPGLILALVWGCLTTSAQRTDSLYIKAFSTPKNDHKNGLHIAYSADGLHWTTIGDEYAFVKSDYGPWGSEKRMLRPRLFYGKAQRWYCVFDVNDAGSVQGITETRDGIHWKPQEFLPKEAMEKMLHTLIPDTLLVPAITKLPRKMVDQMIGHVQLGAYRNGWNHEKAKDDPSRFPDLAPVEARLKIDFFNTKKISNELIGIFFEDINYAADGGLYAELVQNRGFEYSKKDRANWNSLTAWRVSGDVEVASGHPLHANNPHYAVMGTGASLTNEGFDGISIQAGEKYDLSLFANSQKAGKISVKLVDGKGTAVGNEVVLNIRSAEWKEYEGVFTATATVAKASLVIASKTIQADCHLDMVSLFPQKTFKNRKNGLRADLAQQIADLKPRFVRFPGGCVAHGNGLENIYHWKHSIGALQARKPDFNLWGYHQSKGLGFYEYFQFCADIGATPVPVLAAGVPCQNSRHNHQTWLAGQQGGIPLDQMDEYIQDVLDLIEYANADPRTSVWARQRAAAGHPEPFGLKYLGIGNEDLISEAFKTRFEMIYRAVAEKYPDIQVIGTVGPFYEGPDYEYGWDFARQLDVPMVDEHYYVPPGWMIHNQQFYDRYDRSGPKVYLGEYAAHLPGRPNNVETALAEALHLCNIERNADLVTMTSYAPLLAKAGHTQWNPDLMYFDNGKVTTTPGYEIQKLFGNNSGDEYVAADLQLSGADQNARLRIAQSIVRDSETGDLIVKLVNLLPVETRVQFENLPVSGAGLIKTVFQGRPEDQKASVSTQRTGMPDGKMLLPRYSFTVIRIKNYRVTP